MDFANYIPSGSEKAIEDVKKFFDGMEARSDVTEWKDHVFPPQCPSSTVQFVCEQWEPKDGDVILATYPKTGTTWTNQICRQLLYPNDEKLKSFAFLMPLPLAYAEVGPMMDKLPLPRRIILTHIPANLLNLEKWFKKDIKVLYVMRNPKDQAVSWYHFSNKLNFENSQTIAPKEWDKWLDCYTAGKIPTSAKRGEFYPHHISSWLPYKNHPKVLWLSYEELHKDNFHQVKRIAEFLGCDASDENVTKAATRSSFANMKKMVDAEAGEMFKQMEFLRKGKVGEWKKYFTVTQSEQMDRLLEAKLAGSGVSFIYE